MKLDLSVTGDIVNVMRAEVLAGEKAVTTAMRATGSNLKSDWRAQITRARLGQRLANTIRSVWQQRWRNHCGVLDGDRFDPDGLKTGVGGDQGCAMAIARLAPHWLATA